MTNIVLLAWVCALPFGLLTVVLLSVMQKRQPVTPRQYVERALEAFGNKAKVSISLALFKPIALDRKCPPDFLFLDGALWLQHDGALTSRRIEQEVLELLCLAGRHLCDTGR